MWAAVKVEKQEGTGKVTDRPHGNVRCHAPATEFDGSRRWKIAAGVLNSQLERE